MITWYAVYTRPHGEAAALDNLLRQGYCAYLPRYRTRVRHARRLQSVLRPLFPRYLFAGIDRSSMPWRPILSTIGVTDVVRAGDEPHPVATDIVTTAFAILFGAVALAVALAFGLGNRELAGEVTRQWYNHYRQEREEIERENKEMDREEGISDTYEYPRPRRTPAAPSPAAGSQPPSGAGRSDSEISES